MMAQEDPPELARADLAAMTLQILDFHGPDLPSFPFFQAPPAQALEGALNLLRLLGAIDKDHRLTARGKRINGLPLHPRIACILDKAVSMDLLNEGAAVCALLSERSPNMQGSLSEQMDQLRKGSGGHDRALRRVIDAQKQLQQQALRIWPKAAAHPNPADASQLGRMLLAGYPDRLCVLRSPGPGVMVGGRGVSFDGSLSGSDLFIALDLVEVGADRRAGKARQIVGVSLGDVQAVLETETVEGAVFDASREAVAGVRRICCAGLTLVEKSGVKFNQQAAEAVLVEQARGAFSRVFQPDKKAEALLFRLRFAAKTMPEESWPDVSEAGLMAMLPGLCIGMRSFAELRKLDWCQALLNALSWPLRRLLDEEAPERMAVPSGSKIAIDYAAAFDATGYPILAVRLQEMFGQAETPCIAKGRSPLLLHLLAPNFRPCQVTRDLKGFWNKTYAEVRKELRQRYPKHAWPEDPWTAQPMRGAKRRKP